MDANGVRYHLLLGRNDWARCAVCCEDGQPRPLRTSEKNAGGIARNMEREADWDNRRAEVTLRPEMFRFKAGAADVLPDLARRRGAARDRYQNWYWIDETGREIRVNSSGTGVASHFWTIGDGIACQPKPEGDFAPKMPEALPTPLKLSGLTVTDHHYLVVGVLNPPGLLIFDLHAGGLPQQILWPKEVKFAPFDMAPRPGGGVWILDRTHRRYWALDHHFNISAVQQTLLILQAEQVADFQPLDADPNHPPRRHPARAFPEGFDLSAASPPLEGDPIAIEALPDDTILILDGDPGHDFARVARYRSGEPVGEPVNLSFLSDVLEWGEEDSPPSRRVRVHDFAFVPEHKDQETGELIPDRLYVVSSDGNQSFVFDLSLNGDQLVLELPPELPYFPMRRFSGKALVAAGDHAYYDLEDRWVPLVQQRRARYVNQALLYTPVFDGREPGCVWHRLMLDACIPPGTEVRVRSRAADERADLRLANWRAEPQLRLRGDGSELPFVSKPYQAPALRRGTWELLFQNAQGRYLQLELEMLGDRRQTPRLRALRAYYPRFSYLHHYLPGVYRENTESASFLDRFLANFEGFYTPLEDKIAAVQTLFDPRSAPPEALEWLASWFEIALNPAWDETRRRLFIAHAMEFFQWRGTARGLQIALRLALEKCMDERLFEDQPESLPQRIQPPDSNYPDPPPPEGGVPPLVSKVISNRSGIRLVEGFNTWRRSDGVKQLQPLAHRFTVYLPVASTDELNTPERAEREALARRLVQLEKPAHTQFTLQYYWNLFRVGAARLGEDTLIHRGSRAPELLPPIVLNHGYLAEGHLAPTHPQDTNERNVIIGRDRLNA